MTDEIAEGKKGKITQFGIIYEDHEGDLCLKNFHAEDERRFNDTRIILLTLVKERLEEEINKILNED